MNRHNSPCFCRYLFTASILASMLPSFAARGQVLQLQQPENLQAEELLPQPDLGTASGDDGAGAQVPTVPEAVPLAPRASSSGREYAPAAAQRRIDSISFDETPLAEAMRTLSKEIGLNVVTSADAGKTIISVYLEDVPAIDALDAITKANGLFYRIDQRSGIVRIATLEEYERDLASFRDEETRVFTLLYPNPTAVAQVIQNVYGERVELNAADNDTSDFIELSQRFNRFDLVDGRALGLGTFDGGNSLGGFGGGGGIGAGGRGGLGGGLGGLGGIGGLGGGFGIGGGLTGRSRARINQQALLGPEGERLSDLTASEIQDLENRIAVEGDVSDEQRSELLRRRNATIFVSTIRRNNQVIVRTGDIETMEQIAALVTQLDVPTPTVLLEVKVLRVVLDDGFNSAFEYFAGDASEAGAFSDGNQFSVPPAIPFPGGSTVSRTLKEGLGLTGTIPGSLTFQVINDNFRFRMQLLQSKNRVTALATPLVLTANNEVSRIFVGDTLPFTVGFTPAQIVGSGIGVDGAIAATPITELRDVGQSLLVTPNINADRTVTLRIVEENSDRIINGATIPVPSTDGTAVNNVSVDTVRRRSVSGTAVAQDGMAIAFGGLIEEELMDTRDQIPVLGDIPKVGILFRRQATYRQRSELIVMIRPYIFNTPDEGACRSQSVIGRHTLHPSGPDPVGTMNTFLPCEVIRADPECASCARLLRLHSVVPKVY